MLQRKNIRSVVFDGKRECLVCDKPCEVGVFGLQIEFHVNLALGMGTTRIEDLHVSCWAYLRDLGEERAHQATKSIVAGRNE